jgi:signal transduction histidine kinase
METPGGRERALIAALSELAAGVQRSRSVIDVARVAADGLTSLGFVPAIARRVDGRLELLPVGMASQAIEELRRRGLPETLLIPHEMKTLERVARRRDAFYNERLAGLVAAGFAIGRPDGDVADLQAAMDRLGVTRALVCPLLVGDSLWGVLVAGSTDAREEDVPAFRLFGLQVASALEVAETIESLERRNRIEAAIHAIASAAVETDLGRLMPELLRIACGALESDYGAIFLLEPGGRWLKLAGVYGYAGRLLEKYARVTLDTATGTAAASLRPRAYHVAADWPEVNRADLVAEGFVEIVVVPLHIKRRPAGAMHLTRRTPRPFTAEEIESASLIGEQVAIHVENARLVEDLKTSYDRLAKAQSELVERERMAALGELAALVAHEVRNSVAVIFNSLGPLKRQVPPVSDAGALLCIVQEEADRLAGMVSDFLDFARPKAPALQRESIEGVVQEAADAAMSSHDSSGIEVSVEMLADLPAVQIDVRLLRQAFFNLVSNAIEASPRGGRVRVRARVEGEGGSAALCVEVEDDGPGIPEKVRERLFQPFVTTKASGTGLGLAVVKRIVESHGGEVSVKSPPGRGATFIVTLPLETEAVPRIA